MNEQTYRRSGGEGKNPCKSRIVLHESHSDSLSPMFARTNADGIVHRQDEDLAVTDAASASRRDNRFSNGGGLTIVKEKFDFDLGEEIDNILCPAIQFGVPLLPTESLDFRDGHTVDAQLGKRFFHVVKLERFDNGFDLFHNDLHQLKGVDQFRCDHVLAGEETPPTVLEEFLARLVMAVLGAHG